MRLVDSHCHLQSDRFAGDLEAVLDGARRAGVERILVPGWNRASSEAALELADRVTWLDSAVGVHPHDASSVDRAGWPWFEEAARDERVVAIGETGLDFDRLFSPPDAQLANLRRNLALGVETGKPVILHCRSTAGRRDAQDALVAELSRVPGARAVLHSFSGPADYAEACLELGATISFSGLVFRAGEEASAAVASEAPLRRLLVETDAPYLSPPGAPRRRNAPEHVAITARWLAERRGGDGGELGDALVDTYDRTFPRIRPR
ncbi:MAG TPA: TatD family hydrolase [Candidatus Limnocylindrales bacterium]